MDIHVVLHLLRFQNDYAVKAAVAFFVLVNVELDIKRVAGLKVWREFPN